MWFWNPFTTKFYYKIVRRNLWIFSLFKSHRKRNLYTVYSWSPGAYSGGGLWGLSPLGPVKFIWFQGVFRAQRVLSTLWKDKKLSPALDKFLNTPLLEPVTPPNVHNTTVLSAIYQLQVTMEQRRWVRDIVPGEEWSPPDVLEKGLTLEHWDKAV